MTERPSVPPQVARLLLLTIAIVLVYFIARHFLVPESYGLYGPFRGVALKEIAKAPIAFAGRAACAECHEEQSEKLLKGSHKAINCEACHGPAFEHAENPGENGPLIKDPLFCLRCHEANISRPAKFPQIKWKRHYSEKKCIECHLAHHPKEAAVKK